MQANVNANRAEYNALVALDAFVGLTAIIGGLALLVGWIQPPLDVLRGSPFPNYVVPSLALLIVVGGTATMASIAVLAHRKFGIAASFAAGSFMMVFEIVETAVIGPASWLQLFYFVVGLVIAVLAYRASTSLMPDLTSIG